MMRALLLITALLAPQSASEMVWTTRGRCQEPTRVRAAIAYHQRTVYRGVLSLCQSRRDALPAIAPRVTTFSFFGAPRDFAPNAPAEQRRGIEGRIWELAPDAEGIRLGIAFAAGGDVLLNTIRSVSPTAVSTDTLAAHVVVSFEPANLRPRPAAPVRTAP
jgi:hypothetical protein